MQNSNLSNPLVHISDGVEESELLPTAQIPQIPTPAIAPVGSTRSSSKFFSYQYGYVFFSTFCVSFAFGIIFSTTALIKPVHTERCHWSNRATQWSSSIMLMGLGIAAFIIGPYVTTWGAKKCGLLASTLSTSGLILAGVSVQTDAEWLFFISLGALLGTGVGIAFIVTVEFVMRWHPTRRGFAGGFMGISTGIGSAIFVQINSSVGNELAQNSKLDLYILFYALGGLTAVMTYPSFVWMAFPGAKSSQGASKPVEVIKKKVTRWEILSQPRFYIYYVAFFCVLLPAWGVISVQTEIFDRVCDVASTSNKGAHLATGTLLLYSLGRLGLSSLADRAHIGVFKMYYAYFICEAIALLVLSANKCASDFVFVVVLLSMFGGGASLLGASCGLIFGAEGKSTAVGLLMTSYGSSGFFGTLIMSQLTTFPHQSSPICTSASGSSASFSSSSESVNTLADAPVGDRLDDFYYIMLVACGVGAACTVWVHRLVESDKKRQSAAASALHTPLT